MKKVIIIGCSGAGKSTFARKLRDVTGLPPHTEADEYILNFQ